MSEKKVFCQGCLAGRNPAAAAWKLLRKTMWRQKRNSLLIVDVPADVLPKHQGKLTRNNLLIPILQPDVIWLCSK